METITSLDCFPTATSNWTIPGRYFSCRSGPGRGSGHSIGVCDATLLEESLRELSDEQCLQEFSTALAYDEAIPDERFCECTASVEMETITSLDCFPTATSNWTIPGRYFSCRSGPGRGSGSGGDWSDGGFGDGDGDWNGEAGPDDWDGEAGPDNGPWRGGSGGSGDRPGPNDGPFRPGSGRGSGSG